MRVLAFAPSLTAEEAQDGGLNMRGFPMTSAFVDTLPVDITVSVVIVVAALAGQEYNPALYLGVTSPTGQRLGTMQFTWQWDDVEDVMVKFRSFLQYMPIPVETEGVYTLGLYDDPDTAVTDHSFPLAIFLNPNPAGV